MLASRPVAPKTPHTKLRNENQFATHSRAFPKTPLPKELLNTTNTGKNAIQITTQPRKALLDKTPGTHLHNRVKITLQDPNGKAFATLDQKPPSASRKSVKRPRPSAEFQTPDPATQKPYWDVSETSILEQAHVDPVQEEEGDFDEPEYMPPTAEWPPIDAEYDLPTGAELGKKLMELARTPYHCYYNDTPPSWDHEVFLIPEDQLIIHLRPLSPDTEDEEIQAVSDSAPAPVQSATSTRSVRSRSRAQAAPVIPTRSSSRLAKATVASQGKAVSTASRSLRAPTKKKENALPAVGSKSRIEKGKGRAKEVGEGDALEDQLLDCPPELIEMFKHADPVFEDFKLELSDDDL